MKHSPIAYPLLLSTAIAFALVPNATGQETSEDGSERTLDTVVVRGEFIPEPQRETSQVASFLSAEDLARTGDDNAALALTRLSGLSVVGGRFAYVRGLGDRYSSALLNGSPLPSPEPLRRTVPLDLFPASVLDGAAVQKTYSANYPGEFGGGVIDLETIGRPAERFASIKVGLSANTESTFNEGLLVRGSDTDFFGYDDGLRDIPGPIDRIISQGQRLSDLSPIDVEIAGESLVNAELSVLQDAELDPGTEFLVEAGTTFYRGDYDIGIIGVAGFQSDWTTEESTRQFVENGVIGRDFQTVETTYEATANALGSVSVGWGENDVSSTLFYVHSTSKEAQRDTGTDFNVPGTGDVVTESSGWFERELAFLQFAGDHGFGDFTFNWRGSYAISGRDAPYERELNRFPDGNGNLLYNTANQYRIRFSELDDEVTGFGADLAYRFDIGDLREGVISGGYDYQFSDREYDFVEFVFAGGNNLPFDVQTARPDFLFSPDNIDPARFFLSEAANATDSYDADLEVNAAYLQADLEVLPFIRTTLGLRYEEGDLFVQARDRFGNLLSQPDPNNPGATIPAPSIISEDYTLPSATFTWNFADDLQLRLAYSETIARPQFRELAPSIYLDPNNDRSYRGNQDLINSELTNYDARLEYYLGRNQFLTLAGFFKEIENPIEEVQYSVASFVYETTFINSPKAELFGGEFEYRTTFAMPLDNEWVSARDWLFSLNYTYTSAEVQAGPNDLVAFPLIGGSGSTVLASQFGLDGATLQGTPENILNMQFGWEGDNDQLTLLLGWVDERILQRGLTNAGSVVPDVIEDPGFQLDLVYRYNFTYGDYDYTLGLSGRNLLGEDNVEVQRSQGIGETDFNTFERGTSFSASLTAKF